MTITKQCEQPKDLYIRLIISFCNMLCWVFVIVWKIQCSSLKVIIKYDFLSFHEHNFQIYIIFTLRCNVCIYYSANCNNVSKWTFKVYIISTLNKTANNDKNFLRFYEIIKYYFIAWLK